MLGSEYILKYISDYSNITSGVREVERINKDMANTLSSDFSRATKVIGTSLDKVIDTPIKLKGGEEAIRTVARLGTVIQTSDGSFKEFTKTQTFVDGQLIKTSGALKDVTGQFAKTSVETAKAQKNFLTLGENISRLLGRALITIPVWMALRGAIQGTSMVIRDGIKTIIEQDKAWQKAGRTLQGSTTQISQNFQRLRDETTKLSLETGESIEKITNAFYKFSTVGFDFETSMKGAEYATKTAIIMFGDAEETANAFARAMRVLVDNSAGAKPQADQIAEAMALTSELWKSNAFELNEFTQSLEKFAGTAKATNFTTQQTISLLSALSTAGLRGGRAGTQFRTSVLKLLQNLDQLGTTLGVKVNPEIDSTFDVLMKVLDAVQDLDEGSKLAQQTANAIGTIFGGIRGAEAILGLKALRGELLKNLATIGDVGKLDESFEKVSDTIGRQVTIFHNLNKEIGKSFIQGIVGGDSFADTLDKINKKLTDIQKGAEGFGQGLSRIFSGTGGLAGMLIEVPLQIKIDEAREQSRIHSVIQNALSGTLPKIELEKLFNEMLDISTKNIDIGLSSSSVSSVINNIKQQLIELKDSVSSESIVSKRDKEDAKELEKTEKRKTEYILTRQEHLDREKRLRDELKAIGLTEVEIEEKILQNKIDSGLYSEKELKLQQEILNTTKKIDELEFQREGRKALIDTQLQMIQAQGATNLQILQAKTLYEDSLGINRTRLEQLNRELEIQKEITKERLGLNELSSETIQLYKIAEKFGTRSAGKVAEFLRSPEQQNTLNFGNVFDNVEKLLEEFFPSKLESLRARKFFFEGAGAGFGAGGYEVPIQERGVPSLQTSLADLKLPKIETNIENIKLELKTALDKNSISSQVLEELSNALKENPTIKSSIEEIIENY